MTNAGTVDFDPALDGVLSGRGSSTLVVLGAAIQIDATALDASSFNLAGIGTFSSDVVQIVVLLPGGHRYQTTGFDFVFSVTESATVDYDPFLDDILSGRGTNILVVLGTRPIAIAGPDQTVFEGDTVQLDGSGSFDPQGSPLTYQWQLLVPGSSAATLSDPMAVNPTFVADLPGDYLVQLIVNDGTEDSNPDEVTITAQTTEEATEDVVENVEELVEEGDLEGGQGNALTNKLQQAINKIPTQPQVAINLLNAFINQVSSLVEDGELSTEEGQALIDAAQAIIDEIEAQMRIVEAGPQEVLQALVEELPETYALHQNYPNPFNPETTIHYELPEAEQVTLRIFDTLGRVVAVLVDGPRAAGRYDVTFDASGLPSGVYLYQIRAGTFVESRRLVLLK